jgi:uncharacterized protein YigE (DUF2233 family)
VLRKLAAAIVFAAAPAASANASGCASLTFENADYIVCRFDPDLDDIRIFLADAGQEPFKHFSRLEDSLNSKGETLRFAMNAGMYRPDRSPVGLFVEDRIEKTPLNRRDCSGNFCLKPNGVFWIFDDKESLRQAWATTTEDYAEGSHYVRYATQSGPMLVVDGAIHPRFLKDSTSRHRRNGVGVTKKGEAVFAVSDAPVTFYQFATLFRDGLQTPNALYFDGSISRLYAPELGRNEPGAAMGPIVAVVGKIKTDKATP